MLRSAEDIIPGLSERVVFQELGTPVTNVQYCESTRGSIYGTEKTLGQMGPLGFMPKTRINDLWLCGASTLSHGIAGATTSGLIAATQAMGVPMRELLQRQGPTLRTVPCDRPDEWPSNVGRRTPTDA